ncbi:hypothetical protein DXG01_000278 [Tephrocybe rancida]|nr:hypothetical protein DXG01_000278 [Tephrocybe rancida]
MTLSRNHCTAGRAAAGLRLSSEPFSLSIHTPPSSATTYPTGKERMIPRQFKGKSRAVDQTEGNGGAEGIVLPLQITGSGVYDVAYTIQVQVGPSGQALSLQVDTGSSDLWIASKSYKTFHINYLQGEVSGPVVWDRFVVGGYSIENQALAAADSITNEPLGPLFSGILGLALPLNSIIAGFIPPVTSNSPDGAAWASNLFSITPSTSAPSARFISLLLSRPGSDTVPAQLGIGRHPTFVSTVGDPGNVEYDVLESEREGTLFWKVAVRAITVWVGGEERPVDIGRSNNGAVFPSAVLDSGVPLILTTSAVANGIYGAIGVAPAADGHYYVPCTTPLNITLTLDDRAPISLHPLDLTAEPPEDNAAAFCIGLIQPADSVLAQTNSAIGDIILGVPFLRNTYTVMAYEPPDTDGSFNLSTSSSSAGNIKPRLGLLGLTDPTTALDEFNTVRVLNKPITSGSGSSGGSSGSTGASDSTTVGKHLSVGIIVLICLLGFFALCVGLFGLRWWLTRRRFRRGLVPGDGASSSAAVGGGGAALVGLGLATEKEGGYAYALTSTHGSRDLGKIGLGLGLGAVGAGKELYKDEETMRNGRYEAYMQDHGLLDLGLGSPKKLEHDGEEEHHDDELGFRGLRREHGQGAEWGDETLITTPRSATADREAHERNLSIGVPLLHEIELERTRSGTESTSSTSRKGVDEFGVVPPLSRPPPPMPIPLPGSAFDVDLTDMEGEEQAGDRTSMAGVGTAARGGKIAKWGDGELTLSQRRDASGDTSESGTDIAFRRISSGGR